MPSDLLNDLIAAREGAKKPHGCSACDLITLLRRADPDLTSAATTEALNPDSGIGARRLSQIFARNEYAVGEATIMRHRREAHTP